LADGIDKDEKANDSGGDGELDLMNGSSKSTFPKNIVYSTHHQNGIHLPDETFPYTLIGEVEAFIAFCI
jgi:hypothetical protein